jgi:HK97 family phage portal protein
MKSRGGQIDDRERRSLENPNVPLNISDPDDDTLDLFGASRSQSGVRVTQNKALGYPAVWRAVSLITGDVAKLPLLVYGLNGANKTVDRKHPAYRLTRYKANRFLLAYHLKQILTFHALIKGDGFAFIDRVGPDPKELLILDPDKVEPTRIGGELWYLYGRGEQPKDFRRIPAADILHIKGLGFDGLRGYPVLQLLRESLGSAIAARDFSSRYFKNNTRPGGLVKHPSKLSDKARVNIRESWERIHKGFENAHKIAILEEGADYVSFTTNAKDAQLLESREFDAREVANIFGVPTHKLGDPSKVAYNSLEQENQSYWDDTLVRWLELWAAECSDKLLSEKEKAGESHCFDWDYHALQRASLSGLTAYATAAVNGGWENVDEIRAHFGKNPLPGGKGQEFKVTQPAPIALAPPVADKGGRTVAEFLRPVVRDAIRRMAKRIVSNVARFRGSNGELFSAFMNGIPEANSRTVIEAISPCLLAVGESIGKPAVDASVIANELIGSCLLLCSQAGVGRVEAASGEIVDHVSAAIESRLMGVAA